MAEGYKCSMCGEEFGELDDLSEHVSKSHGYADSEKRSRPW